MCGICGIVDFEHGVDPDALRSMVALLRHRGPDDEGIEVRAPAALGFRRLSIIDLAGSHQPMSNETGRVWMVFNGEVYNYRPLREDLARRGHRFRSSGDGETVLHLYEEHGLDFVDHLNGMFAVALWDEDRQRLVLARDRLGIKPLYYSVTGSRIVFASETKAIAARSGARLDREAVTAYMNYSSIPGRRTCLEGIQRLLPGERAVFDRSGLSTRTYWDVSFESKTSRSAREVAEEVEGLLDDAVRLQMASDVPLGVFLSGGVDSSLIAALMVRHSSQPVRAFAIGYGSEGRFLNETAYARKVADAHGMRFEEVLVDARALIEDIEKVVWHLDEPCGDPAAFLTLALSRFTRRSVTVALSGLGADEIFSGYRRYLGVVWQRRYARLPRWLREAVIRPLVETLPEDRTTWSGNLGRLSRKFVRSMGDDLKTTWERTVSYLPDYDGPVFTVPFDSQRRDHFACAEFEEIWQRASRIADPIDRVTYLDLKMYMVDQLLLLQDKMSMAVSLEARVPYLDHRLVELAATIPSGMKMEKGELKSLLKRIAAKHVPRECVYRPKQGFGAPLETWLRGPLRERVRDLLSPARVRERGVFEAPFVEWLKKEFFGGGRDLSIPLYQVFLLEIWSQLYLDDSDWHRLPTPAVPALGSGG
jgi:asparagine synthase (glutamine-hydrolysing)